VEQLCQREKELDDLVASANEKLQGVDFETWLEEAMWYHSFPQETPDGVRRQRAVFLGFACVNARWQLAVREGTYCRGKSEDEDAEANEWATDLTAARPLSSEPRYIRARALDVLIDLVAEMRLEVRGMLEALDHGKESINNF
jgi:hypothetical protein